MGLPNHGINSCVPHACCCCDLCYHICSCWFVFLPNSPLRVWTRLRSGDLLVSKKQPQHFTLPLGSGVVRYLSLKVRFSTCSANSRRCWNSRLFASELLGAGSSGPNCRDFQLSLIFDFEITQKFLDTPIHPPLGIV